MMPRPKTRTYALTTYYTDCGTVREVQRHTVTVTRDAAGTLSAAVNGQDVPYAEADALLSRADVRTITHEAYLAGEVAA